VTIFIGVIHVESVLIEVEREQGVYFCLGFFDIFERVGANPKRQRWPNYFLVPI
jgi:hypothetical protein